MGSSRYAALLVASELRAAGTSAWVEYASTGAPTAPAADLVFVAISASGRTAEVVAAARRHRGQSLVVAVTNDPESALASEADHVLPLLAGSEGSGIATRTFRATVAVLAMLGGHSPASLSSTVAELAVAIESAEPWVTDTAAADRRRAGDRCPGRREHPGTRGAGGADAARGSEAAGRWPTTLATGSTRPSTSRSQGTGRCSSPARRRTLRSSPPSNVAAEWWSPCRAP